MAKKGFMGKIKTQKGYAVAGKLLEHLIESGAFRATAYLSPKFVMKMTMKRYKGKLPGPNDNVDIVFSIGEPSAKEYKFIKKCKKAGEPFPVKKIQLNFLRKGK